MMQTHQHLPTGPRQIQNQNVAILRWCMLKSGAFYIHKKTQLPVMVFLMTLWSLNPHLFTASHLELFARGGNSFSKI